MNIMDVFKYNNNKPHHILIATIILIGLLLFMVNQL